jgi:hypothetical protein
MPYPPLTHASSKYGAQMGRPSYGDADTCGPIYLRHIRLVDGGAYDHAGAYWGSRSNGLRLYCAVSAKLDTDGLPIYQAFLDARDRSDAAARILAESPLAQFRAKVNVYDTPPPAVDTDDLPRWWSGNYVELTLTMNEARSGSHSGRCDSDVAELRSSPRNAAQLDKIDPESLRLELKEYGAWDETELSDHSANLDRIVWLAAGYITDDPENYPIESEAA